MKNTVKFSEQMSKAHDELHEFVVSTINRNNNVRDEDGDFVVPQVIAKAMMLEAGIMISAMSGYSKNGPDEAKERFVTQYLKAASHIVEAMTGAKVILASPGENPLEAVMKAVGGEILKETTPEGPTH